jgi:putative two-component system response regulator
LKVKSLNNSLTSIENIVISFANAVEAKDAYTQGHVERVSNLARTIGQKMGLSAREIEALRFGGVLHDIGKIGISEAILNKPGPLNPEEWKVMKGHTDAGEKICLPLKKNLGRALKVVRHHHEKLDGSGYPDGLKGEEISIEARIMAVVDIYDALVTARPYRKAMGRKAAFEILHQEAREGKLDKKVVELLMEIIG